MLNHRQNKEYNLYDVTETADEYGARTFSQTAVTTLNLNVIESNNYAENGEPRANECDAFTVTWYVYCKPGQILQSANEKYQITRVINSTRFAQLYLKKI